MKGFLPSASTMVDWGTMTSIVWRSRTNKAHPNNMATSSEHREIRNGGWKNQDPLVVGVRVMVMKIELRKIFKQWQETPMPQRRMVVKAA